ncbi:MAG: AzlC family ABC transporter permease [Clostridia bacterium]|nr:AzlC family ABC transporter permease [Clostridia bacterium]
MQSPFWKGFRTGLPVCLGYVPVAFAFAVSMAGRLPWQVILLVSVTNFTSAGQAAGSNLMAGGAPLPEIGVTVLLINVRYMLMSLSLSQKMQRIPWYKRLIMANGITDEVFFLAAQQPGQLSCRFFFGLALGPYMGWVGGTLGGILLGSVLPAALTSALGIALYAMFIAIMIPPARKDRPVLLAVLLAAALSCLLYYVPGLREIPAGWALIAAALAASLLAAWLWPHPEEQGAAV